MKRLALIVALLGLAQDVECRRHRQDDDKNKEQSKKPEQKKEHIRRKCSKKQLPDKSAGKPCKQHDKMKCKDKQCKVKKDKKHDMKKKGAEAARAMNRSKPTEKGKAAGRKASVKVEKPRMARTKAQSMQIRQCRQKDKDPKKS